MFKSLAVRVGEPASSGARGFSGWLVQTSGFSGRDEGEIWGTEGEGDAAGGGFYYCWEYVHTGCYKTYTSWSTRKSVRIRKI